MYCLDLTEKALFMHCVQRMIRIGELARMAGVTPHCIRKWTLEALIPHVKRPGERALYPEDEALEAVRLILQPKGGVGYGGQTGPSVAAE